MTNDIERANHGPVASLLPVLGNEVAGSEPVAGLVDLLEEQHRRNGKGGWVRLDRSNSMGVVADAMAIMGKRGIRVVLGPSADSKTLNLTFPS